MLGKVICRRIDISHLILFTHISIQIEGKPDQRNEQ